MVDFDVSVAWPFDDPQPQAGPPDVVRLSGDHLPLRLAHGILQLLLLLPDPGQALDDREAYAVLVKPPGRGHANPAGGRVHTDVQVLDVLVDDLDVDPADSQFAVS